MPLQITSLEDRGMAAAYMLSQHSSNPLEVHSSDARNSLYVNKYRQATNARSEASSDDRIGGCDAPDVNEYHQHLSTLYGEENPVPLTRKKLKMKVPPGFVDLDEDMSSDEDGDGDAMQEDLDDGELDAEEDIEDIEIGEEAQDAEEEADVEDREEENSILLKPPDEQAEIHEEIDDLERAVPQLTLDYKIIDRLGTGTFSSVYKALDLGYHSKWDNQIWHGRHPPASSAYYQTAKKAKSKRVFVAIKRIYVTSGPERIRNEISIMEDCRNCRHVSQLITAFREKDQVVAVMPYHSNDDFRVSILIRANFLRTLSSLKRRSLSELLPRSPPRGHQSILSVYVPRTTRHTCPWDRSPRCKAGQLPL